MASSVNVFISALIPVSIVSLSLTAPKIFLCLFTMALICSFTLLFKWLSLISKLFTCFDSFSCSGILMLGFIFSILFFRSIIASSSLSVSSPMIPSNEVRPGKTKNSIIVLFPMLSKNLPVIFLSIWISPPADFILKGFWAGFALVANSGRTKFLFAPVSMRNLSILPLLVS